MKDAPDVILIFRNAHYAKTHSIYIQRETFKYVGPVEIKSCLVHATNVQLWDARNAKKVISNLVLSVTENFGVGE